MNRQSDSHQPTPIVVKQSMSRLTRHGDENPDVSPTFTTILSNKANMVSKYRSTSATKARSYKDSDVNNFVINLPNPMTINTQLTSPTCKKKPTSNNVTTILPRRRPTSPSAWALSPGRVSPFIPPVPPLKSPSSSDNTSGKHGSGGIKDVLKYFRMKKAASSNVIDQHCFLLMSNRLLQWQFANARAETTMSIVRTRTEKKLFNAWLKILTIRNSNMVKRMEVERAKNNIKLYDIMNSQLFLLEKWSRIEAKNFEAVGRVVRKLSVASINVPLLHDSKAEKSCYLLTELSIIAKEEIESLVELQTWMTHVVSIKVCI
ncbi:hypothetical protein R6Q57_002892 [Mikania cordata]